MEAWLDNDSLHWVIVFQYPLMDRLGWKQRRDNPGHRNAVFQYPLMDRLGWKGYLRQPGGGAGQFQYPLMDRLGWKCASAQSLIHANDEFQYPLMDRLGWKANETPQNEHQANVSVSSDGSIGVEVRRADQWHACAGVSVSSDGSIGVEEEWEAVSPRINASFSIL